MQVWKMVNKSYQKGKKYELKLFWRLAKLGWYVVRAPASGSGSSSIIYPDLIAYRSGKIIGIEVKARSDDRDIQLSKDRFRKLVWIEQTFGIKMYLCVHYKFVGDFKCIEISSVSEETNSAIVYRREDIVSKGVSPEVI